MTKDVHVGVRLQTFQALVVFFRLDVWVVSNLESSFRRLVQNLEVQPDTAFQLRFEIRSIQGVAVIAQPHLSHPVNVVLYFLRVWNWAESLLSIVRVFKQSAFAFQLENQLSVLQVLAGLDSIRTAGEWFCQSTFDFGILYSCCNDAVIVDIVEYIRNRNKSSDFINCDAFSNIV